MTFTECNPVEQMILDAAAKLGGKSASERQWNTRVSDLAL